MSKPLVVHPEAKAESQAAFDWYFDRNPVAAERLAQEIRQAYQDISKTPQRYATYPYGPGQFRLLRNFPYSVIYFEHDDHVGVYAVAHNSRKPGYWSKRTNDPSAQKP